MHWSQARYQQEYCLSTH